MTRFEYLVRSDFHEEAENASRGHGGRERERTKAYDQAVEMALNKLGAQGWELMQAPDDNANRKWIFKRLLA
ncbi:MAG: hypothetical protein H6935_03735 [Thiobacillus sp.]|nr:hypothetical protein [Thiobacillus sp.]